MSGFGGSDPVGSWALRNLGDVVNMLSPDELNAISRLAALLARDTRPPLSSEDMLSSKDMALLGAVAKRLAIGDVEEETIWLSGPTPPPGENSGDHLDADE
jgi:hypothetical protein